MDYLSTTVWEFISEEKIDYENQIKENQNFYLKIDFEYLNLML